MIFYDIFLIDFSSILIYFRSFLIDKWLSDQDSNFRFSIVLIKIRCLIHLNVFSSILIISDRILNFWKKRKIWKMMMDDGWWMMIDEHMCMYIYIYMYIYITPASGYNSWRPIRPPCADEAPTKNWERARARKNVNRVQSFTG